MMCLHFSLLRNSFITNHVLIAQSYFTLFLQYEKCNWKIIMHTLYSYTNPFRGNIWIECMRWRHLSLWAVNVGSVWGGDLSRQGGICMKWGDQCPQGSMYMNEVYEVATSPPKGSMCMYLVYQVATCPPKVVCIWMKCMRWRPVHPKVVCVCMKCIRWPPVPRR